MCLACYEDYDSPCIKTKEVLYGALLIYKAYEYGNGYQLHIQLDDWNLEDRFWDFSKEEEEKLSGECLRCVWYMKGLSLEERVSALAIYEGFIEL